MGIQSLAGATLGKACDFDTFCEYILPYRIGDEPLSLWRKEIYECYSPILDEFRKTDEADNPKVAAQLLMDTLRKANYRNTALFPVGPHLGPDVLKWHTGSCREFTDAMIYVLRALGIPCGVDRVMVLGDNNASHFWNFVLDKEGKTYIANLPYEEVWSKAEEYSISRGKMYRATYSIVTKCVISSFFLLVQAKKNNTIIDNIINKYPSFITKLGTIKYFV